MLKELIYVGFFAIQANFPFTGLIFTEAETICRENQYQQNCTIQDKGKNNINVWLP